MKTLHSWNFIAVEGALPLYIVSNLLAWLLYFVPHCSDMYFRAGCLLILIHMSIF